MPQKSANNMWTAHDKDTVTERTVQLWFVSFEAGDLWNQTKYNIGIYWFSFHGKAINASKRAHNTLAVYFETYVVERTVRLWFVRFTAGDFWRWRTSG